MSTQAVSDKVYGTEAARLIGISRSTILRYERDKRLPADGVDADGSRYWFRSTIHAFMAGKPKSHDYVYIRNAVIDGLAASEDRYRSLVTGRISPLDLIAPRSGEAFIELLAKLTEMKPAALGVGYRFAASPFFGALLASTEELGTSVVFVSSK